MALQVITVQGSDGVEKQVLIDSITGEVYTIPLYKIGLGALGANDGPVAVGNPMPVVLQDPNDATRQAGLDAVFKIPVVLDVGHHEIHEKHSFMADTVNESMGDDDTITLAFKTMAGTKRAHMFFEFSTLVGGDLRVWEGPTWTAETGTLIPILNRFREATPGSSGLLENQAQAGFVASDQIMLDPTGLNTGSATSLHHLYTWGKKEKLSGGIVRDANEWPLKPDTQYAVRFTADGASNKAQVILNWYEHTDE